MINRFTNNYRFLSNFWPVKIVYENLEYPSVENAYQASKDLNPENRKHFTNISAKDAKYIGQNVKLRGDWDNVKLSIMETLVRQKFTNDISLKHLLLNTGDEELIEGNYWGDKFWGVCDNEGENHLGKILMKVRKELKDNNEV